MSKLIAIISALVLTQSISGWADSMKTLYPEKPPTRKDLEKRVELMQASYDHFQKELRLSQTVVEQGLCWENLQKEMRDRFPNQIKLSDRKLSKMNSNDVRVQFNIFNSEKERDKLNWPSGKFDEFLKLYSQKPAYTSARAHEQYELLTGLNKEASEEIEKAQEEIDNLVHDKVTEFVANELSENGTKKIEAFEKSISKLTDGQLEVVNGLEYYRQFFKNKRINSDVKREKAVDMLMSAFHTHHQNNLLSLLFGKELLEKVQPVQKRFEQWTTWSGFLGGVGGSALKCFEKPIVARWNLESYRMRLTAAKEDLAAFNFSQQEEIGKVLEKINLDNVPKTVSSVESDQKQKPVESSEVSDIQEGNGQVKVVKKAN